MTTRDRKTGERFMIYWIDAGFLGCSLHLFIIWEKTGWQPRGPRSERAGPTGPRCTGFLSNSWTCWCSRHPGSCRSASSHTGLCPGSRGFAVSAYLSHWTLGGLEIKEDVNKCKTTTTWRKQIDWQGNSCNNLNFGDFIFLVTLSY